MSDPVNTEVLRLRYDLYKHHEIESIRLDREYNYVTRRNGLPEHISENIVKFVLQNYDNDPGCTWNCKVGDLHSPPQKKIECKSFTSDGPISFGPKQQWDVICFLDARRWQENIFTVWKVSRPNTDALWKNIRVNKKQTKEEQSDDNRRPRVNWETLRKQIPDEVLKCVYTGTFEDIFTRAPAISMTTGTDTALPANEYSLASLIVGNL